MSPTGVELVDLVARWIHMVAGIMWIGNSLLFNWLDRNLETTEGRPQTPAPAGTIWLLHSGGFYYVEKTLLGGASLPSRLHWFKWQAYATWISGMVLLLAVYWIGGRAGMTDPSVAALERPEAIAIGAGAILLGWLLYEAMNRLVAPRAPAVSAAVWSGGLVTIAVALTQLLSGRAAFLHVGAMLGTLMAANVLFTIVPSQRALVRSVTAGGSGSDALSARAKRVSVHNNYFTFPVIVLMMIGHFPSVYGHRLSWLLLLVLVAGGALVRHVLNIRFGLRGWRPMLFGAMGGTVAALVLILRLGARSVPAAASGAGPVSFFDARHVIDRRCLSCHSADQSDPSYGLAPGGVMFDTENQIREYAERIRERAVVSRTMPPANKTGMTEAERALLGRWVAGVR